MHKFQSNDWNFSNSFILDVACIVLFQSVYLNKKIINMIVFNEKSKFNFDIIFFKKIKMFYHLMIIYKYLKVEISNIETD